MQTNLTAERPLAAFILSLIGGVVILGGSWMLMGFSSIATYYGGMMGSYYGMMGGYYGMMQGFGFERYFYAMAAIAVISAIIILVGAIMVYNQPSKAPAWGALILAFSILSLLGMGGFFFGAILGVVGGILALTWRQAKN